ncbi:MAG: hypothetical protein AB7F28_08470 [Candidatus Margulisiibacteriota bacterium]
MQAPSLFSLLNPTAAKTGLSAGATLPGGTSSGQSFQSILSQAQSNLSNINFSSGVTLDEGDDSGASATSSLLSSSLGGSSSLSDGLDVTSGILSGIKLQIASKIQEMSLKEQDRTELVKLVQEAAQLKKFPLSAEDLKQKTDALLHYGVGLINQIKSETSEANKNAEEKSLIQVLYVLFGYAKSGSPESITDMTSYIKELPVTSKIPNFIYQLLGQLVNGQEGLPDNQDFEAALDDIKSLAHKAAPSDSSSEEAMGFSMTDEQKSILKSQLADLNTDSAIQLLAQLNTDGQVSASA